MEDIAALGPHQPQPLLIEKDETEMRKEAKGVLKSPPAPPRPLGNSLELSKILGKEGDDLIGLTVVEGADDNGMGREERHQRSSIKMSNAKAPSSNKIQSSNEMPKQVLHDKDVILNLALKPVQDLRLRNPLLKFDIHLAFGFWHLNFSTIWLPFPVQGQRALAS